MKKHSAILLTLFLTWTIWSQSNQLNLTWIQPMGYQSIIYSATNLNGQWKILTNTPPPACLNCTNSTAFFIVLMQPTNQPACYGGYGAPTNAAMPGSIYVQKENNNFWECGTNGWIELIQY